MQQLGVKFPTQSRHPSDPEAIEDTKCQHCRDMEYVHPRKEDGKIDYSTVVPCRHCVSQERLCSLLGVSSLESTFDNFKLVKGVIDTYTAARSIATLQTEWKLLLICGTWGSGKTHLLEAIALEIWSRGYSIQVQTFPDFMSRLKGTFDKSHNPEDTTFNDVMGKICTMPYLLLDDVGSADSFTTFALSQLERIMLTRYRENLLTVMTTNVDYEILPKFVTSRFNDAVKGRILLNKAPDYRPKKGG